ncbi:transcription termination factor 4, mitochondrial isoform B [Alligator mississippiensis]|uniref:Transcription termination factor 4, mitochondrial isoform B n=1 Tax=Alligator mississippiensis TaxID=8496 RepID=A0A151NTX9_ALLMI|nr:transcription termination factor 4, mitochondrial isoform B [Alligator mississippiensis]
MRLSRQALRWCSLAPSAWHRFLQADTHVPEPTPALLEAVWLSLAPEHTRDKTGNLVLGNLVQSLLDMGFSHTQRSPNVLRMSVKQLKDRGEHLRQLGLSEGHLKHVVSRCPPIFTLPGKKIDATVRLFKEKCLFTTDQVMEILRSCPNVLLKEPSDLEYKFQYAFFRMGVKHKDVVKSGFFRAPFTVIRSRHVFLERRGLYQTPDKKGQTQVINAKLKEIIWLSDKDFLAQLACASLEEYDVFKKLLAREEEEEEEEKRTDSEDEDEDSEGEGELPDHETRIHALHLCYAGFGSTCPSWWRMVGGGGYVAFSSAPLAAHEIAQCMADLSLLSEGDFMVCKGSVAHS